MQYATESGSYNGWSIDAIQEQKMGVAPKTSVFNNCLTSFSKAMDEENYMEARTLYHRLKEMVNPESAESKILDMDMEMMEADDKW